VYEDLKEIELCGVDWMYLAEVGNM